MDPSTLMSIFGGLFFIGIFCIYMICKESYYFFDSYKPGLLSAIGIIILTSIYAKLYELNQRKKKKPNVKPSGRDLP